MLLCQFLIMSLSVYKTRVSLFQPYVMYGISNDRVCVYLPKNDLNRYTDTSFLVVEVHQQMSSAEHYYCQNINQYAQGTD